MRIQDQSALTLFLTVVISTLVGAGLFWVAGNSHAVNPPWIALVVIAIAVVALVRSTSDCERAGKAPLPSALGTVAPGRTLLRFRLGGKHWVCVYSDQGLCFRLQDMGRLEFLEVNVIVPQHFWE